MNGPEERAKSVVNSLKEAMLKHTLLEERRALRLTWEDGPRPTRYLTVGNQMDSDFEILKSGKTKLPLTDGSAEVEYAQVIMQHYRNLQELATRPPARRQYIAELGSHLREGVMIEPKLSSAVTKQGFDEVESIPLADKWKVLRKPYLTDALDERVARMIDGFFEGKLEGIRNPDVMLQKALRKREKESAPLSKAEQVRENRIIDISRSAEPIRDFYDTLSSDSAREFAAAALLSYVTQKESPKYVIGRIARDLRKTGKFPGISEDVVAQMEPQLDALQMKLFDNTIVRTHHEHNRRVKDIVGAISLSGHTQAIMSDEALHKLHDEFLPKVVKESGRKAGRF